MLVTDVPLPQRSPEDLRWNGVPRDLFVRWCGSVGLPRLPERVKRWA